MNNSLNIDKFIAFSSNFFFCLNLTNKWKNLLYMMQPHNGLCIKAGNEASINDAKKSQKTFVCRTFFQC